MPIDPARETPIPFQQAPEHIPGRPHISTLHRWRLNGARNRKLETFLRGGRRFTTLEAIQRFLCPDENGGAQYTPVDGDRHLQDRAQAAERQLDKLGI
jgi:hypothetical protein